MAIPRILYQTYKSYESIPRITRLAMWLQRRHCLGWKYEFYSDERIAEFLKADFGGEVFSAYDRLAIGAAKADFFRYAVLYKYGGVYLDVDSAITGKLDELIDEKDVALIARENNPWFYVQWALAYAPGHAFLARTIEKVMENIKEDRHSRDVHKMTGPSAYSEAIHESLAADPDIPHRVAEVDYGRFLKFKRRHTKVLYKKEPYWKDQQEGGVLKKAAAK
jgi:mannosyltransferase OCH1-like enzyme